MLFFRPDGTPIKVDVPQITTAACPEPSLKQRNAQRGIVIGETTAYPNWDGQPMDRAIAVDCMFSSSGDFKVEHQDVSTEVSEGASRRQSDDQQG